MSFTYETETNNKLPFLDILVTREDKFTTMIYRKPTFSGLYTNYHSYMPDKYKTGLFLTLLFRTYTICSDWVKIHQEILNLRQIMIKNNFPSKFLDSCIKSFFDKLFQKREKVSSVPRKIVTLNLPFMGKESLKIKKNLLNVFKTYFPFCRLQITFSSAARMGNFFVFKDKVPNNVRSLILYKFSCGGCNSTYLGKSKRHYLVRVFEHLGMSLLTGKKYTFNSGNNNNTTVLNHINCNNCHATINNFRIIGSAKNDFKLCLKESLLIQLNKFNLNKNVKSMPLYLFDS